jgi:hypothetical protein
VHDEYADSIDMAVHQGLGDVNTVGPQLLARLAAHMLGIITKHHDRARSAA